MADINIRLESGKTFCLETAGKLCEDNIVVEALATENENEVQTQEKSADITANGSTEIIPDSGYALSKVTVNVEVPVPEGYIRPNGTADITENGTHDIAEYESINVDVPIPEGYIQPSGTVDITENGTHDISEYESINVDVPIPEGYIQPNGTLDITENGTHDVSQYQSVTVNVENAEESSVDAPFIVNSLVQDGQLTDKNDYKSITIGNGVTTIGTNAFKDCSNLEEVNFSEAVETIGESAFSGCASLTNLDVPNNVTEIQKDAFSGCTSLETVNLSDSITTIEDNMFYNCTSLDNVVIPEGVTAIDSHAFDGCASLTRVTIPNSVTSLGEWTFKNCTSLTSITYGGTVAEWEAISKSMGWHSNTADYTVYCTDGELTKPTESKGLAYAVNDDGESCSVSGIGTCTDTEVIIPATYEGRPVTSIGDEAFYGCASLKSITIHDDITSIGDSAFYDCDSLESITIPNSVTNIGERAFYSCTSLTSITVDENNTVYHSAGNCLIETESKTLIQGCNTSVIPDDGSVTNIGNGAFAYSRFTSINIPDSVTSIGDKAFYYCSSLESITIPNSVTSIGENAFYYCKPLTSITIPDSVMSIGGNAFVYCYSLKSVHITDVEAWCNVAFATSNSNPCYNGADLYLNGEKITNLVIPDTVTDIKKYAFYKCNSIESVTIPNSVTSIDEDAFFSCSSLSSITIPSSVTSIADDAFYNCSALTSVHITDLAAWCNVSFASYDANPCYNGADLYLNGEKITDLVIPDTVTDIKNYAFYKCDSLESITIPNSVTNIAEKAFDLCYALETITYNGTMTEWEAVQKSSGWDEDFGYYVVHCSDGELDNTSKGLEYDLSSDEKSYSVTGIGEFSGSNLIIPATYEGKPVTSISGDAFSSDYSIKNVIIPDSVTSIGERAFQGCYYLESVTIGKGAASISGDAFDDCSNLESITIDEGNTKYSSAGNCLIDKSSKTLIKGFDNSVIPDDGSVTSIGGGAFYYCSSLESITIPDGITSIGYQAFYGCSSLRSITIPASVTSIGERAFEDCNYLESITVDEGNTKYSSAGNCLIDKSSKTLIKGLDNSVIPDDGSVTSIGERAFNGCDFTSIAIPKGVTSIGEWAFFGCYSLESITIPSSVTSIDENAFYSVRYLKDINYGGTKSQWNAISKGSDWDDYAGENVGGYTVHCIDGDIT